MAAARHSRANVTSSFWFSKHATQICCVWIVRGLLPAAILALAGCATPNTRAVAPVFVPPPAKSVPNSSAAPISGAVVLDPRGYEKGKNRIKLALAKNAHDSLAPSEVGYYMDVLQGRLTQVASKRVAIDRDGDSIVLDLSLYLSFKSGSAQINPAIRETLLPLSKVLIEYRMTLVSVQARAEDTDKEASNPRLAELRALAVAHYLTSSGVVDKRIVIARPDLDHAPAMAVSPDNHTHVELRLEPIVRLAANGR